MDRKSFIEHIRKRGQNRVDIAERKTHDYATESDPFWSFRLCEIFGLCSTEVGIMVQILHKIGRTCNLLNWAPAVKDETIHDTLDDAVNYLDILDAYLTAQENDEIELADALSNLGIPATAVEDPDPFEDDVVCYFAPCNSQYASERKKKEGA